jgi:hypothetical protein
MCLWSLSLSLSLSLFLSGSLPLSLSFCISLPLSVSLSLFSLSVSISLEGCQSYLIRTPPLWLHWTLITLYKYSHMIWWRKFCHMNLGRCPIHSVALEICNYVTYLQNDLIKDRIKAAKYYTYILFHYFTKPVLCVYFWISRTCFNVFSSLVFPSGFTFLEKLTMWHSSSWNSFPFCFLFPQFFLNHFLFPVYCFLPLFNSFIFLPNFLTDSISKFEA